MTPIATKLESALLPLPDIVRWKRGTIQKIELTTAQKIQQIAYQTLLFLTSIIALPFAAIYSLATHTILLFREPLPEKNQIFHSDHGRLSPSPSQIESSSDLAPKDGDHLKLPVQGNENKPHALEKIDSSTIKLPPHFGFSDSLFQSSGLGSQFSATALEGRSNWDRWISSERVEPVDNMHEMFTDILNNPKPFIEILTKMHVTAHRFSLEWSVIEPQPGNLDQGAIQLYRNFIQELKNAGIEPYVTLHHFTTPDWFGDNGDFENFEQIDLFVDHSLKMMELFPEVTHWLTFNEPGIYALQSRIMGGYPPGTKGDLKAAAQVMRNLLIAHCKIYKAAKEKFGDRIAIGITHQWLRFSPLIGKGNPLEKLICYFMSKITHYCVYNFFKTGRFDFKIPLRANVQFKMSKKQFDQNNQFLDFMGVQFYGSPQVKAGWNGGNKYPGYKVTNVSRLTIGSTCPREGKVMSLGLSFHPESLHSCLEEAVAIGKPIAITETGCDSRIKKWGSPHWTIDEKTQREYFIKIGPILNRFQSHLKAVFVWTLHRDHLEWERGDFPKLGVISLLKDASRSIIGWKRSPAAKFLQSLFRNHRKKPDKL